MKPKQTTYNRYFNFRIHKDSEIGALIADRADKIGTTPEEFAKSIIVLWANKEIKR